MSTKTVDETRQHRQAILDLLPSSSPLHRYVQWACSAHGSPPVYHVACALVQLFYELTRRGFRLPKVVDDGEYPLTVQFLLLGGSHTGKGTALDAIQDFAATVWKRTQVPEVDPWIELEGSIEGITQAIQDRYIEKHDSTPAVLYDKEISKVFARREPLTELLCKLADGRTIQSNYRGKQRKSQSAKANMLVNPRVSALYCTTEPQLAPHFKDSHRMGGLFPRLIWLKPVFGKGDIWLSQDHVGATPLGSVRTQAATEWASWLVQLEMVSRELGKRFSCSAEAHAVLHNELFVPFAAEYHATETDDNMHAVKMRLLEKARVFAALHAAMHYRVHLEPEDMFFAVRLAKYFLTMITSEDSVRDLGANDSFRISKRIELAIKQTGNEGMLRRELYSTLRLDKRTLDDALAQLIDSESVFVDNTDPLRSGRYIHISSPLGQEIVTIARAQAREEAELKNTLGARRPSWRTRLPS